VSATRVAPRPGSPSRRAGLPGTPENLWCSAFWRTIAGDAGRRPPRLRSGAPRGGLGLPAPLIGLRRAGVPALLCLVVGIVVIRIVCRRPALRRLSFALSLIALTASVALFRTLVPAEATLLDPYLRFLLLFSLAYGAFKVGHAIEVSAPYAEAPERVRQCLVEAA